MGLPQREFGRTGWRVSPIGFGAWAIGGSWGDVSEAEAKSTLAAALDAGVNFIDTADVYGDGRSERIVRDVLAGRQGERPLVATKAGRRLDPHVAQAYTFDAIEGFVDRSLANLGVDTIDLLQLHCPPTDVYYRPELFAELERLAEKGKIRFLGVSVEKVEEAIKAIEYPNVVSVQIIYNMFRQRPRGTAYLRGRPPRRAIGRHRFGLPLASGLPCPGKKNRTKHTSPPDDHRKPSIAHGEAFDLGEDLRRRSLRAGPPRRFGSCAGAGAGGRQAWRSGAGAGSSRTRP